jgi:hypothetical protein
MIVNAIALTEGKYNLFQPIVVVGGITRERWLRDSVLFASRYVATGL